jgi:hypothetical protein
MQQLVSRPGKGPGKPMFKVTGKAPVIGEVLKYFNVFVVKLFVLELLEIVSL